MSGLLTEPQIIDLVVKFYPTYDPSSVTIDGSNVYIKQYGSNVYNIIPISEFYKLAATNDPVEIIPVSTYTYSGYPYPSYSYYGNSRPGQWSDPWHNSSINPNHFSNTAFNSTLTNQNFGNQNFSQGFVSAPIPRK
jgi:hypothetical protein